MKHPGGGRYNQEDKKIVFNSTFTYLADLDRPNTYLYTFYEIHGPRELEFLQMSLDRGDLVLIDSGTHSIYNIMIRSKEFNKFQSDRSMDIHDPTIQVYFQKYCDFVKLYEHDLWGYIELDLGNYHQKTELREQMEAQGLTPIPVFHPLTDPLEYLDTLASNYDRICFGNMAVEGDDIRSIVIDLASKTKMAYPHLWIHLLGVAISPFLASYPYADSVDTSTSSSMIRFGRFTEYACFQGVSQAVDDFILRTQDRTSYLLAAATGYRQFHLNQKNWKWYYESIYVNSSS